MRRNVAIIMMLGLLIVLWSGEAVAQKKRTTRRPPATKPAPVVDMRPEANLVSEQITTFTKFLYVYGKIVYGLEFADEQAKHGQSTPEVAAQNKKSRDALIANIGGLRTGLEKVVQEFKANPRLQVQYLKLSYASEAATNAERLASANRYDEAGQALVTAIERMSETIISMRLM
ncbi:MAG: hypothetical protein IPM66_23045 [Acidobacteriota bacterium]|nr:MAG: hypothetical protein IPM66_23045 [Acidobacteriota bacterium]